MTQPQSHGTPKAVPAPAAHSKAPMVPLLVAGDAAVPFTSGLRVCLWGMPFCGKTHCALTFPDPIFIHWDESDSTIKNYPRAVPALVPTLDHWTTSLRQAVAARGLDAYVRQDPRFANYTAQTYVFDSWTKFAERVQQRHLANPPMGRNGKPDTQAAWGAVLRELVATRDALTDATRPDPKTGRFIHYVGTTHEREVYDGDALERINPSIPGQFKDAFFSQFDVVMNFSIEAITGNVKYMASTQPGKHRSQMGDRFGGGVYRKLPATIESPTFQKMCQLWGMK